MVSLADFPPEYSGIIPASGYPIPGIDRSSLYGYFVNRFSIRIQWTIRANEEYGREMEP